MEQSFGLIFLLLTKLIFGPYFLLRFWYFAIKASCLLYMMNIKFSYMLFKENKSFGDFISLNLGSIKIFIACFFCTLYDATINWVHFMEE